jgi:hypothetical protein
MKMKFLYILFVFCAATTVSAQVKKTVVKPTQSPKTVVETVEIKPTQKVVIEKNNGDRLTGLFVGGNEASIIIEVSGSKIQIPLLEINVLKFGEESVPVKPVAEQKTASNSLSFETGVVFKSGDVKPVARATFYLLDESLEKLLMDVNFQIYGGTDVMSGFALKYVSRELEILRGSKSTIFDDTMLKLKPHILTSTTTDFNGKGQFTDLAEGVYYIMHVSEIGRSVILWNLRVEVKPGQNSVTLDQNNAAQAF